MLGVAIVLHFVFLLIGPVQYNKNTLCGGPRQRSRYSDTLLSGFFREWIHYGGEIFRTFPYRSLGPPSLLYNGYRISFPGVKRPGRDVNHTTTSNAEVKERVEIYFYSPSGLLWPVRGRNFRLMWMSVCEVGPAPKPCDWLFQNLVTETYTKFSLWLTFRS